jgi:hypothetical protein
MSDWKVITPGPKLGQAPMKGGRFLVETRSGIEVAQVRCEEHARLIAAAPALLDALRQYMGFCGNTCYSVPREVAKMLYDNAEAAIKEAEGGV